MTQQAKRLAVKAVIHGFAEKNMRSEVLAMLDGTQPSISAVNEILRLSNEHVESAAVQLLRHCGLEANEGTYDVLIEQCEAILHKGFQAQAGDAVDGPTGESKESLELSLFELYSRRDQLVRSPSTSDSNDHDVVSPPMQIKDWIWWVVPDVHVDEDDDSNAAEVI